MTKHVKNIHDSVIKDGLVQGVINFLSPRPPKDPESEVPILSQRELFQGNNDEDDDELLYNSEERRDAINALRIQIVPDKDFLRRTLPAGELTSMLAMAQINKIPVEAPSKPPPKQLTCAECLLGKEVNREQDRKHKDAEKTHKATEQKI